MIDRNQVKAELSMRIRFAAGGTVPVSGVLLENALELIEEQKPLRIGRWVKSESEGVTPGGTSIFECGACGGSNHLHGAEYPNRKVICDNCGRINIYPWEKAYEQDNSFWESDGERKKEES